MAQKRYTKKQLAWRPGQRKQQRSIAVMFGSSTLTLEALVVVFAGLALFGKHGLMEGGGLPYLLTCVVIGVVMILTCAFLRYPWGIALGWSLQVVMIALGILEPMMYFVGALFGCIWAYGIIKGKQMDRENVQRARAQAEWEAQHGEA
ncbi:hypothetical protein HMPREF3160_08165 [Arthrobacter sp. HMSC06H05]|uniref:DUF4233 domain-containing protein n=1 Tax=Arthrobacter sp. HMSC06H05 TaxID=1581128 RepID=UPI0008A4EC28|nr:DUF4233 domain-containing protein [Arthrobacter sp. HMSC06H05]OFT41113.1 hypothetical protein HMPREF3160_08165 [Arthrobacter sp. HMSC06H05]